MGAAYDPILANNTWEQIAEASEAGVASRNWSIGDEKNMTLTTGETLTLKIYGFRHDDLADGSGKAGITFGMKNLMASNRQMNSTQTNAGGFAGSAMYTWLTGTLLPTIPADLRNVIKSVNKKTSAGNQSTTINTNSMKVFLFSEIECFGTSANSAAGEGTLYPVFTDASSRIKYMSNGAGAVAYWWLRSPVLTLSTSFGNVTNVGGFYIYIANGNAPICFGFCI